MHIPDGLLSGSVCAGTACLAGAGVLLAAKQAAARWSDKTIPMAGVMSAFIFAGQMVNFPIPGGTSGHLLGGVLAAALLGPWTAVTVLTVVLFVQCLFFQDGGLTALGANALNMALIGVGAGYGTYRLLRRLWPGSGGRWAALAAGAWLSVVAGAAACAAELALSGRIPLQLGLPAMVLTHSFIGVGEALITVAAVSFVAKVRPDLLYEPARRRETGGLSTRTILVAGGVACAGVVLLLAPLASTLPDGLEAVLARFGVEPTQPPAAPSPLPDYAVPGLPPLLSTVLAGLIGAALALALAAGVGWLVSRVATAPNKAEKPGEPSQPAE